MEESQDGAVAELFHAGLDMGFSVTQVMQCLAAAAHNPDRALEDLMDIVESVDRIMKIGLGYPREQVAQCLRAAANDPDLAVESLKLTQEKPASLDSGGVIALEDEEASPARGAASSPSSGEAGSARERSRSRPCQRSQDDCVVCSVEPASAAVLPCGHLCGCLDCLKTIKASRNAKCPVCRGPMKSIQRIYRS